MPDASRFSGTAQKIPTNEPEYMTASIGFVETMLFTCAPLKWSPYPLHRALRAFGADLGRRFRPKRQRAPPNGHHDVTTFHSRTMHSLLTERSWRRQRPLAPPGGWVPATMRAHRMFAFPWRWTPQCARGTLHGSASPEQYRVDGPMVRYPFEILRHGIDLIVESRERESQPLVNESSRPRLVAQHEDSAVDKKV